MKVECKYCKKEIIGKNWRTYTAHLAVCNKNPKYENRIKKLKEYNKNKINKNRKIYQFNCKKCGKSYNLELTKNSYKKGKHKKFCSRSCANSRIQTNEEKKKKSIANKKFLKTEKGKLQIKRQKMYRGKLHYAYNENSKHRVNKKIKNYIFEKYKGKCCHCNKELNKNGNIYNKKIEWITHHNKLNLSFDKYIKTKDRILLCNSCHMKLHNRIRRNNK